MSPPLLSILFHYSQSQPNPSFYHASFSWPWPKFLGKTLSPSMSSISRRAMVPIFLSMAPPLPMIIPFWLSRSTMIVARIWTLSDSSSRFIESTTTATEWGISSRVKWRTFLTNHFWNQETLWMICDLIRRGNTGNLRPDFHSKYRLDGKRYFPWRAEIGTISKVHLVTEIINLSQKLVWDEPYQSYSPPESQEPWQLLGRSIIISSPFHVASSAGTIKERYPLHEGCCRQTPTMKSQGPF